MQDIRADLVAALTPLTVTSNGHTFSVPVVLQSAIYTTLPPLVSVRQLENPDGVATDIGARTLAFDERYELSIICQEDPANGLAAEAFLKDAANALQAKLATVGGSVGGSWAVRIVGGRPLPPDNADGVLVYERTVVVRAQSVEFL